LLQDRRFRKTFSIPFQLFRKQYQIQKSIDLADVSVLVALFAEKLDLKLVGIV
jgi:hypothetical protein